eukprot:s4150_g6.t1
MKGWWLSSPWRLWAIIPLAGQGGKPRKFAKDICHSWPFAQALIAVLYEVSSVQRRRSPTFDKIASEALQAVPFAQALAAALYGITVLGANSSSIASASVGG